MGVLIINIMLINSELQEVTNKGKRYLEVGYRILTYLKILAFNHKNIFIYKSATLQDAMKNVET